MTQELREAMNNVTVEGILRENKLDRKKSREGKDYISGDLLVQVSPDNTVPVNFFSFAKKKDGTPNKIYSALENVIETYKSLAKDGKEEADKVKITGGRIEANEFYNAAGQLISTFRIRSNFVNRVTDNFNPEATFRVETYLQGITEEIKNDEPTGRLVVTGVVPMYGGRISVLKFFVSDPKGIKYIQDNYSTGDTVKLAGVLDNEVIAVNRTEEMEFGGDIVDTYTRIKRELVVTRGGKPYSDEEGESPYDTSVIKQAMTQREVELKQKEEEQRQRAVNTTAGGVTNDDVPF